MSEAPTDLPPEPPRILDALLRDLANEPSLPPRARLPLETQTSLPEVKASSTEFDPPLATPLALPPSPFPPQPVRETRERSLGWIALFIGVNLVLIGWIAFWVQDRLRSEKPSEQIALSPVVGIEEDYALPVEIAKMLDVLVPASEAPPPVQREARPLVEPVLRITKLELCRSVSGFGSYELLPESDLLPRHLPHIQAYVEFAHPKPQQQEDGRYAYFLTKSMKLYHQQIGPSEPLMDTAVSIVNSGHSPRNDFHAAHPLQASGRVFPGAYTLVVRITDHTSGEIAVAETSFTIQATSL